MPSPYAALSATDTAYVVATPQRFDVLRATLRCAYETRDTGLDQFDGLLRRLDQIDLAPTAR